MCLVLDPIKSQLLSPFPPQKECEDNKQEPSTQILFIQINIISRQPQQLRKQVTEPFSVLYTSRAVQHIIVHLLRAPRVIRHDLGAGHAYECVYLVSNVAALPVLEYLDQSL